VVGVAGCEDGCITGSGSVLPHATKSVATAMAPRATEIGRAGRDKVKGTDDMGNTPFSETLR